MANRRTWTDEEINYLHSHYMSESYDDMSRKLGIGAPTIKRKCVELGLIRSALPGCIHIWTEFELNYLRQHWPTDTAQDIGDALGMSDGCVRARARLLNLKKSSGYSPRAYDSRYVKNYKNNINKVKVA